MHEKEIERKIQLLPEQFKKKVLYYIDNLLAQEEKTKQTKPFNYEWEGALKEENIDSVKLQHRSLEWR